MEKKIVIGFDLYGTLLSTDSIATQIAEIFGHDAALSLATQWRRYQLEYTWRANSMGTYCSFSEITRAALQHAVAEKGLSLTSGDTDRLMNSYNELNTFPDADVAMELASNQPSLDIYIFSNGTNEMVSKSVSASSALSKIGIFSQPGKIVTVDDIKVFKPDPKVYSHLADKIGVQLDQIWVVTANPFDALGARSAGAQSAWIDRAGNGWVDSLGNLIGAKPTIIVGGVDEAVTEILNMSNKG